KGSPRELWLTTLTTVADYHDDGRQMRKPATILLLSLLLLDTLAARRKTAADEPPRKGIENAGALESFFRVLADTRSGRRLEPVRIMHFGDSHTAADVLTAEV